MRISRIEAIPEDGTLIWDALKEAYSLAVKYSTGHTCLCEVRFRVNTVSFCITKESDLVLAHDQYNRALSRPLVTGL